jgi:hypothetical protein
MKIIITETQELSLKLRRRGIELEKLDNIIEYQTEIQNPCTFEGPEDYADFCIGQGISFYYCDEGYCNEDDEDDNEGRKGPTEEMWDVREDVELYAENKFYDYLYGLYEDSNCEE